MKAILKSQMNERSLVKLRYIIKNSSEKKKELQRNSISLRLNIANLETKTKISPKRKRKVEQILKKLKRDEARYRKKLSSIISKQSKLVKTLTKLNILKKEEVRHLRS